MPEPRPKVQILGYYPASGDLRPLAVNNDGSIITNQRFLRKISDGYGFAISKRVTIANGNYIDVYLENPSGSNKNIYVLIIECSSLGAGWIDVYKNVTITTSGTSITPNNLNFSSTNTSIVNIEYNGTYDLTGGTLTHETVLPGGSKVRAIGSVAEVGESIIMSSGDNILVRLTNKSGAETDMSIRIIWWEENA